MNKAKINEVFISIQGEGKFLGEVQCFVRFYNCNLSCKYCDTKLSAYDEYSVDELMEKIKESVGRMDVKTISITGGEPLLQRDFLIELLPRIRKENFNIYLESNGVLHDELFDLIDNVDVVAMDIKLPSSTRQRAFWKEHEEFLKIARQKEVFVKLIICLDTTLDDFKRAVELVKSLDKEITFVIQPNSEELGKELAEKLQLFKSYSKQYLINTRVIPQLHKVIGVK